jgi:hypothetical protein
MCGTPAQLPPQLVIEPNPIAPVLVVGPPLTVTETMDAHAWWLEKLSRPTENLNDLINNWAQSDFFSSQTRKDMANYFGSNFMFPSDTVFAYTFVIRCRVFPGADHMKMATACSIYTRSLINDGRKAVITIGQFAKDQVSTILGGTISSTPTNIGGVNTLAVPDFNPLKSKQHALVQTKVEDFIRRTLS